jgi:HEAT repeat protein
MSHAARAAIESGIVAQSFERLIHSELKMAAEAFALVSLLIKSGETNEIFEAIRYHKDERVKFALLHVLKVRNDERTLAGLQKLQTSGTFPTEVANRLSDTIKSFEQVAV